MFKQDAQKVSTISMFFKEKQKKKKIDGDCDDNYWIHIQKFTFVKCVKI